MDLTIVIPFLDESNNIKKLLPQLSNNLDKLKIQYEVLFVGGIEEKIEINMVLENFINTDMKFIPCENFNSYGNAIKTGIKNSKGKKLITMDADGSHNPKYIRSLYNNSDKADIIIASRYIKGGNSENNIFLKIISIFLNRIFKLFFSFNMNDITSGFKLYDTKLLKSVEYESDDFVIIEEILISLKNKYKNLNFFEIPYRFEQRKEGETKRSNIKCSFLFIKYLIKFKFNIYKNAIKKKQ